MTQTTFIFYSILFLICNTERQRGHNSIVHLSSHTLPHLIPSYLFFTRLINVILLFRFFRYILPCWISFCNSFHLQIAHAQTHQKKIHAEYFRQHKTLHAYTMKRKPKRFDSIDNTFLLTLQLLKKTSSFDPAVFVYRVLFILCVNFILYIFCICSFRTGLFLPTNSTLTT